MTKTQTLLREAVQTTGSYHPNNCLPVIEERLTARECNNAKEFLRWCVDKNRTFGRNIPDIWAAWKAQKKIDKKINKLTDQLSEA